MTFRCRSITFATASQRQATDSLLKRVEIPPDFRIQILEQQRINDMLSKLDFKHLKRPLPAGGLYGYDQQQRLFNSVDNPLVQPYAAFSGGELITIAIENLIARYRRRPRRQRHQRAPSAQERNAPRDKKSTRRSPTTAPPAPIAATIAAVRLAARPLQRIIAAPPIRLD